MNKEDILKQSRAENHDERDDIVRDRSLKWTLITMVILSAVFSLLRAQRGETMLDLTVVVCGSVSVSFFYRFAKTKRRELLILGGIIALAGVLALVRFCLGY